MIQIISRPLLGVQKAGWRLGRGLMMIVSAQLSVYPLRQQHLGPAVDSVVATLAARGLEPRVGPMSTTVTGAAECVFAALADAFAAAARQGEVVMSATVSNACPLAR